MNKKLIIPVVIFIFIILGGSFWFLRSRRAKEVTPAKEPEGVLIETSLAERPYITLTPTSDGHWLTIEVSRIQNADNLEYELLYNTESGATQGSINTVKLKGETSYSKKILLGSESSGHYKYDEGVTQGTLTVRLRGSRGTMKFVTDFHLQQGDDELTSIDGNFSLTGTIPSSDFFVTMSTVGLPGEIEREVFFGPYEVLTSGKKLIKDTEISLTLSKENSEAKLYSWDGKDWLLMERQETNGQIISASLDELTTIVAASVNSSSSE